MFYYLYALERVGRLSGRRFIGDHDWYREGADYLIGSQDEFQGFWSNVGPMENSNVATSFALLFLSKGKRQVVAGRLKYQSAGAETEWNQHSDGLRQLVRHVEKDWGRDLTWQTIDASAANLEDLLQAPVLVMSGTEAFQLTAQVAELLKEYVDQGGCILFEAEGGDACGDASGFERSVNQLCQNWFEGRSRTLPPVTQSVGTAQSGSDSLVRIFGRCRRVVDCSVCAPKLVLSLGVRRPLLRDRGESIEGTGAGRDSNRR